ncbi:hypothetical protein [Nocardia macrotermitis]|uniref:Nucleotidyltransferase n=1 Tax=Nocardia macrotermitis TaxID=2585198 RepID=A0A7K0D1K6_9NOCA|nr:hypothetical protein [Nocardia macrotermitis]MQY19606.1 hypothetical protein [Nocardia macrotermitis]
MNNLAPEYVAARRVLLDALVALEDHLDNLILVGAQAIYYHAGSADLNVPLMTTDADLTVDTRGLADAPEIGGVMRAAGFTPGPNPGHWVAASNVAVDLMVVPHQAGTVKASARAARITPHDKLTARIARGLEPALVDNEIVSIAAFEPDDSRKHCLRVAGPAALVTAKAIKVGERLGQVDRQPDRLKEKDALDIFRLLQAIEVSDLVNGFEKHREDEYAAAATADALDILRAHGTTPSKQLAQLAAVAAQDDPIVAPAFAALVDELLDALQMRPTMRTPGSASAGR